MSNAWTISASRAGVGSAVVDSISNYTQTLAGLGTVQSSVTAAPADTRIYKTQPLSAERAGLKSVINDDPGLDKTQVMADIGVVYSPLTGGVFVIHPFV